MSKMVADGLSRLQNQSRISASKWREWCNLLGLDPMDAVETWEEICHPIMIATRSMPVQEISYILQMRTARPELDIFDFKEEAPKILHAVTFLYNLEDERLTKGKIRSAILKYYKKSSSEFPADHLPSAYVQRFIIELCSLVLIAKVLKGQNIALRTEYCSYRSTQAAGGRSGKADAADWVGYQIDGNGELSEARPRMSCISGSRFDLGAGKKPERIALG